LQLINDIETWQKINACSNYRISSYGRVKNVKSIPERILKGRPDVDGYLRVYLTLNNK